MNEKAWVVAPSWVDLKRKLLALAGELDLEIELTGRQSALLSQRIDYRVSGPRRNLNDFHRRLLEEGRVRFIGLG
jgi:hypothetical protein